MSLITISRTSNATEMDESARVEIASMVSFDGKYNVIRPCCIACRVQFLACHSGTKHTGSVSLWIVYLKDKIESRRLDQAS